MQMTKLLPILILFWAMFVQALDTKGVRLTQSKLTQVKDKPQMLTFGYIEFPPYTYTNKQGEAAGIELQRADELISSAGYRYKTTSLPTKRIIQYLKSGYVDIMIGLSTHPKLNEIAFVSHKILNIIELNTYFIGKKTPIITPQDLINKKVIIIRGYNYGGLIDFILNKKNHVLYQMTKSHSSGFDMLRAKRADYFLAYQQPSQNYLDKHSIKELNLTNLSQFPIYLTVSKKTPNAQAVFKRLEQAIPNIYELK